jgi:hypothetical protein
MAKQKKKKAHMPLIFSSILLNEAGDYANLRHILLKRLHKWLITTSMSVMLTLFFWQYQGFELRARQVLYHLSHSGSPFFVLVIFKIGSHFL